MTWYTMHRRPQGRSGWVLKFLPPSGTQSLDHTAHSQSLHQLHYPSQQVSLIRQEVLVYTRTLASLYKKIMPGLTKAVNTKLKNMHFWNAVNVHTKLFTWINYMTRNLVQVCGKCKQYQQRPKIPMWIYWFRIVWQYFEEDSVLLWWDAVLLGV